MLDRLFLYSNYLDAIATATATATVMPTMGLLPAPRKPIISTWAGHGGGAGELRVGMHAAHGVGHAVGGGAGGHVVRMQGAARAAAGGHGEVLLAGFSRRSFL